MIHFEDQNDINLHKASFNQIIRFLEASGYRTHLISTSETCQNILRMMAVHKKHGHETFYHVADRMLIYSEPVPCQPDDEDDINYDDDETGYEKSMAKFKVSQKI